MCNEAVLSREEGSLASTSTMLHFIRIFLVISVLDAVYQYFFALPAYSVLVHRKQPGLLLGYDIVGDVSKSAAK